MLKKMALRWMPVLMALSFVTTAAPAQAQGEDIGRQMEREYGVLGSNSGEGRYYNDMMDNVTHRIVGAVNDINGKNFRIKSAKILGGRSEKGDRVINAFALPDGRIYVTLGLLRALRDSRMPEDELAFVVGHEVTHVVQKHGRNQQSKAIQAGLLSVLLSGLTRSQAVGQIAGLGANAYVSHYGREDEYRADKGAMQAMTRAGYDPDAASAMLRRLQQKGEDNNRFINGLFGSHPLTSNRINRVERMSANLEAGRPIDADREDDDRPRQRRRR